MDAQKLLKIHSDVNAHELLSYVPKYLRFKQVKPNTAETYSNILKVYINECIEPMNASSVHLYIEKLKKDYSMLTIKNMVSVIRDFSKYLNDHDILPNKVYCQVRFNFEYRGGNKDLIPDDKFIEMINTCDLSHITGLRDYAFLRLLQSSGMRISEPLSCKVSDIEEVKHPTGEKTYLLYYTQKRGYRAAVKLMPKTYEAIMTYIKLRGNGREDNNPLFMAHSYKSNVNKPYDVKSAEKMVRMRMNAVGLEGSRYTAHSFRYSQAIKALELTGDEHRASQQLRHISPKTIQFYTADYRSKMLGLNMLNLEI